MDTPLNKHIKVTDLKKGDTFKRGSDSENLFVYSIKEMPGGVEIETNDDRTIFLDDIMVVRLTSRIS